MSNRIAMKVSEEAIAMIGELTGAPSDVFGEETYVLFEIISLDPIEFNAKFMSEEKILAEVKQDSAVQILGM